MVDAAKCSRGEGLLSWLQCPVSVSLTRVLSVVSDNMVSSLRVELIGDLDVSMEPSIGVLKMGLGMLPSLLTGPGVLLIPDPP